MFESNVVYAVGGVLLGALLQIIRDMLGTRQAVFIAVLRVYHERALAERIDQGIDCCRAWAVSCLRICSTGAFQAYETVKGETDQALGAAIRLDPTYKRNWTCVVTESDLIMQSVAKSESSGETHEQMRHRLRRWLDELEWFRNRQLRHPGAGSVRIRLWGCAARVLFPR